MISRPTTDPLIYRPTDQSIGQPLIYSFCVVSPQVVVDRRLLVGAGATARYQSILKTLFAAALPWPLLMSLQPRGVLWWAAPQLRHRLDKVGRAVVVVLVVLSSARGPLFCSFCSWLACLCVRLFARFYCSFACSSVFLLARFFVSLVVC